jgi:hypothetical protein
MGSLPSGLAANVSGARCNAARRRDARLAAPPAHLIGEGLRAVRGRGDAVQNAPPIIITSVELSWYPTVIRPEKEEPMPSHKIKIGDIVALNPAVSRNVPGGVLK